MNIKTNLLLVALLVCSTEGNKGVYARYGEIVVEGYNNCTIKVGDANHTVELNGIKKAVIPGQHYGLITWMCDGSEMGTEISYVECVPCGTFCAFNQNIIKCQNTWIPIIIGLTIGIVILMLIVILLLICMRKRIGEGILNLAARIATRSDRKRAREVMRHNKNTGQNCEVKFKEIRLPNKALMGKIIKIRMDLRKDVNGDEPLYSQTIGNIFELNNIDRRTGGTPPALPARNHRSSLPRALGYAATATSLINSAYACDQSLYMTSNGKICTDNTCYNMETYSMMITSGQLICFKDIDDNKFEMRLKNEYSITRYSALYRTCNYTLDTDMHFSCKGSGLCWDATSCKLDTKLEKFDRHTNNPMGFGCNMDILGCDTYCVHRTACVWYSWEVKPDMNSCAVVYGKESELWEIVIEVSYKSIVKDIILNTNVPFSNLNDILVGMVENMPIYINNYDFEKVSTRNNLLEIHGSYYDIDASSINMPQSNMIGDLQIELNNDNKIIFHTDYLHCGVTGCLVTCKAPQPSLDRFKKRTSYEINNHDIIRKHSLSKFWLHRYTPVKGAASIMFGNIKLKSLFVEEAHCRLEVAMTKACESCFERPTAVISSSQIKHEGSLEFESNCTWDRSFMSCSRDPYEIKQITNNKICVIEILKTNTTLVLNFEYEFRGELSAMKGLRSETAADAFESIANDKHFWSSLVGSLTAMLSITTIGTILIKLARLGVLAINKKEADRA